MLHGVLVVPTLHCSFLTHPTHLSAGCVHDQLRNARPFAAKDACTCLKRRLQMDHPQKQYLAIILTSKVLQECHAALGPYQGELLQEVAYILRTVRSSSPAAARTRQVAMDVLRHFGSAGGDAYRVARQQGGGAPAGSRVESVNRDPAAIAAERASLLDEIRRMCEQASASTEILNELILNKEQPGGAAAGASATSESLGLRKELLADVAELRRLFDLYSDQLANLTGPDAEAAMKAALEAVDQLDGALSLEKDVDAELKDLASKGQLPPPPAAAAAAEPDAAAAGASSSVAAAAATTAAADEVAAQVQSANLIDLDDEPTAAAPAAPATGMVDPFAPPMPPAAAAAPEAGLDSFGSAPAAAAALDPWAPAAADPADPFAALAAAPLTDTPASQQLESYSQPYPQPYPQAGAAADPFAEPGPAWGASPGSSTPPAAAPAGQPFPGSLPHQPPGGRVSAGALSGGGAGSLPTSGGGSSSAGPTGDGGMPGAPGGLMAPPPAAAAGPYGAAAPVTPGYGGGFMPAAGQGMPGQGMMGPPYGYGMQPMQQQMPSPYGMPYPYAGLTGGAPMYMPQPQGPTIHTASR
ncbi:hypothetical protein COO60DRAFT_490623 [Scenedesmus sp. NREL 46B-D3]|nr:hypothetical protein COO60DRAFT_490623 [Scenedesmus sp. NREL 46B-D3]